MSEVRFRHWTFKKVFPGDSDMPVWRTTGKIIVSPRVILIVKIILDDDGSI